MDSRNILRRKGAKDVADALRSLTAEEYKRQNKPGLDGFAFSKSSMETDVAGLEAETYMEGHSQNIHLTYLI